jgi:hypothetical protein
MSCNNCQGNCQCTRVNSINVFSKDYKAGKSEGQREEHTRTSDALIELERKEIITNAQLQAILDLILEKLTDQVDIL